MEYIYEIKPFSCYDNWTKTAETKNICGILDKLLRITTKITEWFASDILYDIHNLNKAVEEETAYDRVLVFRESGVSSFEVEDKRTVSYGSAISGIQVWRLTHDPDTEVTMLTRVYLCRYSDYSNDIVGM